MPFNFDSDELYTDEDNDEEGNPLLENSKDLLFFFFFFFFSIAIQTHVQTKYKLQSMYMVPALAPQHILNLSTHFAMNA